MSKPRLLDLFCGVGGCGKGYQRAGFYVVGVDNRPQPNYCGDEFFQGDALNLLYSFVNGWWLSKDGVNDPMWWASDEAAARGYVLADFDAIHASPPCQAHTSMNAMWNAREHPDLISQTRTLLIATGLPYVIENVPGAPLEDAVTLCGASLGLGTATHDLARHRLFECNWPLMVPPCAHGSRPVIGVYGDHARDRRRVVGAANPERGTQMAAASPLAAAREAMGIPWANWRELSQAVPPAYTEIVGTQLLVHLHANA